MQGNRSFRTKDFSHKSWTVRTILSGHFKTKQSKLKGFSFNKGKVREVIVRIGSSLQFHRDKDLFLSSSKNSDRVHKRFDLVEVIT